MSFLAISGLINLITCTVLEIFVVIKNFKSKLNRIYLFFNLFVAVYSFGYLSWALSQNTKDALIWFKVLTIGFIPINAAFLHFVFYFIGIIDRKKKELIAYYLINVVFIFLTINSNLYSELEPRYDLGYWPIPTFFFHIYLIFWFYQCIYAFIWLIKGTKLTTGLKREQIKYFTIAALVGFGGGATNWPMWYNVHFPPYPNILISLYAVLMPYAIIKYQLLNIKVTFTRGGLFVVIYFITLAIPFGIGYYYGFGLFSSIYLFVMATLGPFIYRYLQRKADSILLADQKRYQRLLYNTADKIVKKHDLGELLESIVNIIVEAVKINYAVIFLEDKEDFVYKLKAYKGSHPFPEDFFFSYTEKIVKMMKEKGKPYTDEDINNLFTFTKEKPIQLIIPVCFDKRLLGFLFLGEKLNKSFYSKDDCNAFELLATQAGLAIENCFILEDNKKIQERIFQAEKFSLLGGMAEGIAHQIKNRLNYFSVAAEAIRIEADNFFSTYKFLAVKYLDLKKSFKDLVEISDGMLKNVKRTDEVIHYIIDYACIEHNKDSFSEFPFNKAVDLALNLVKIKHDFDYYHIAFELETGEPGTIYGIMNQIVDAIYNLLDNSFEAIEEKIKYRLDEEEKKIYNPVIRLKLEETDDYYVIEAFDNGIGIEDENKSKIFAPYFTTKSSFKTKPNPGIGMYVMDRIIEEVHRGKIWVESEYMKGTTFYIKLPKKRAHILHGHRVQ